MPNAGDRPTSMLREVDFDTNPEPAPAAVQDEIAAAICGQPIREAAAQEDLEEQVSVWLTVPGGVTVLTRGALIDDSGPFGDEDESDESNEDWLRRHLTDLPEGTIRAEARRRTRSWWSDWEPIDLGRSADQR